MSKKAFRSAFAFWLAMGTAIAQKDAASLLGRVLDSSGAAVVGAQITATDVDRNSIHQTVSDAAGEWTISPVHIGTYRVTVSANGFKAALAGPITLDVQQRQRVDVSLQPGDVKETVEVHETAPLLETDNSERGQVITSRTMVNLPLNGRNPVQLAQLTAGVTVSEPGARDEGSFGFSANGARSLENNFLLDGIDNNSNLPDMLNGANYVVMPSVDALQEFKVQTDSYNAEFGRANGAVVNAAVKSGTNELHGVAYEFLRNEKLDARNFFDTSRLPYKQNQFGGTLGGPLIRNKLFIFGDYEGLRIHQAQTLTSQVPTAAQRSGDFSSYLDLSAPTGALDCNGHMTYQGEIFNTRQSQKSAANPNGFCGLPFGYNASGSPSNVIPAALMDPLGLKLINLFPMPNVSGNGYNYLSNPVQIQNNNQGDIRVDQVFSTADSAFYRFSETQQPSVIPGPFSGLADGGGFFTGNQQINGYSAAISETHVFSPTRVNELRLGYNRLHAERFQFNSNDNISAQLGFPGVPYTPGASNGGLPQLTFSDASTLGSPTYLPSDEIQNTYSASDTFTLISGAHSWKFGGEFRPQEFTILQPSASRGYLDFGTQFTDNAGVPGSGGSGLASLLAGQPDNGSLSNIQNLDYLQKTYSGFIQDDWRATRKLTLNLGLRYEFYSTVKERFNAQANFNPDTGQLDIPNSNNVSLPPILASILNVNRNASDGLIHPDFNNFAPRVGLAYQITPKLVWRSAAGMFYNGNENGPYSHSGNPPFTLTESYNVPCSLPSYNSAAQNCSIPGISNLQSGFPLNALLDPNTPGLAALDPYLRTPYVWQWHGTLQYQASSNTLFEVAYVGSKGTKLYTKFNVNQAYPTADASAPYAPRRPFPSVDAGIEYFNTAGNSEYDAFQTKLQRRFSGGLSILANYTYGHALGNASDAGMGAQNNSAFRWSAHPEWEHGNLDFDVRHRFVANYIWEIPFGRGKHFGTDIPRPVDYVIGNWQISGITTLSSGTWYTVTDANGNFANSDGQQRPNAVVGQNSNGRPCIPGTFFNTCGFTDPAEGSFGNVGQNTLRGPGVQNWDVSLLKTIPVTERRRLEFRAECFNIANHANFLFAPPGPQNSNNATVFGTPSFGYLTAARAPREIQFGLKFYF